MGSVTPPIEFSPLICPAHQAVVAMSQALPGSCHSVPGAGLPAHLPKASPSLLPELAKGTLVTLATGSHEEMPLAHPRLLLSCLSSLDPYSPC